MGRLDKTRQRRIRHHSTVVGCGAGALSDLRFRPAGLIRRTSVASGIKAQLSDAARAPYPTYGSDL
ncbi:hypothetical protein DWG93_19800 [Escherichia coli]|nr:hypothetical protein [Escherichia coli]EFO1629940.1 hypothetical protein [Escherichia coli]